MYDKSKKTWSQRLKIHKNEKSQQATANDSSIATTLDSNTNTALTVTTTTPQTQEATLNVAHNVKIRTSPMPQYQLTPTAIMHLPTLGDYHHHHQQQQGGSGGSTYEYMPQHLGRSVKYAEPWLYGTVRGIPTRPAGLYHPAYAHYVAHPHAATIFTTPSNDLRNGATAMAVVLCSCPEYLSGTKGRTLKKPSLCKKCKGTRLPLANIGGTVRLTSNIPSSKLRPAGAASTVRVVSSTKKQRPTILDPQKDPYDLMRRTRLLSPEPGMGSGASGKDNSRNSRGRSASPVRGRSRTRHHQKALVNSCNLGETSKTLENLEDSWLTESEDLANTPSTSNRRSILRCNVNPYDLISINQQNSCQANSTSNKTTETSVNPGNKNNRKQKLQYSQNEFKPPNDDFNVQDAAFPEDEPHFVQRSNKAKAPATKVDSKKVNENLISSPATPPVNKIPNYGNVQAIAGQRISFGEEQQSPKSLLQQSADGTATYESFAIETPQKQISKEAEKPIKPRPDTLQVTVVGEPKRPPRAIKQQSEDTPQSPNQEDEELLVAVTVTPTYNIKSILKRPTSKTSESGEVTQTDSPHTKPTSLPSTPKPREGSTSSSKSGTPTNSRRNPVTVNSPTANSQFYIPMPQVRKKVQFVVDDNQEEWKEYEDSIYEQSLPSSSPTLIVDLKNNYEYYTKKRHQKQLDQLSDNSGELEDEVIIYDEKFIQAMLLEKLQLDSEMVSQRYNKQQPMKDDDDACFTNFLDNISTNYQKTDYEDAFSSNNDQSKTTQISKQQETENKTVANNKQQHNERKINENLTYDKQSSTSSSSLTAAANETTNCPLSSPPTPPMPPSPQSSSSSSSTLSSPAVTPSSISDHLATHHVTDMSDKTDDVVNECLPSKEKIFIAITKDHVGDADIDADNDDVYDYDDDDNNNSSYNVDVGGDNATSSNSSSYTDIDVNVEAGRQHHIDDNNHNDDKVNVSLSPSSKLSKAPQKNEAQTSTTINDYDDDAKIKQQEEILQQQQQQQLLQLNNTNEGKKDMQTLAATDRSSLSSRTATKETQSRNPIRRSQSERQPTTYRHNNSNNSNNYNSNNGYNHNNTKNSKTSCSSSGSRSIVNENIITNARNSLKDIENIPNIKDAIIINGSGSSEGVRGRANKTLVNFQDTMALRNRYNRNDTRDLFTMAIVGRPREAPPPPPSPSPTTTPFLATSAATATSLSNSLPMAKNLTEATKSITLATDAQEDRQQQPQTVSGLESKQREQLLSTIGHELTTATTNNTLFCKEINGATLIEGKETHQPQMTNGEKFSTNISSYDKSYDGKEATSKALPQQQQRQQKTVVRVAPFNKNSSEVHRLKISHTDNMDDYHQPQSPMISKTPYSPNSISATSSHYSVTDLATLRTSPEYGQQKTSILISGDDCYSTMNLSCDDSSTPLYQSSVVVTDDSSNCHPEMEGLKVTNTYNTVTINLSSPRSSEDELIQQHNQLNNLLKRQSKSSMASGSIRAIIPIRGTIDINLQRSASSTSSTSTSSITSSSSSTSSSSLTKRGKTLIRLDYDKEKSTLNESRISSTMINEKLTEEPNSEWLPHETELLKILRNPVEAVKRNLVPHICKLRESDTQKDSKRTKKMNEGHSEMVDIPTILTTRSPLNKSLETSTFIDKLLEDPMLNQVADGLENDTVAELIENSLKRLQESRQAVDMTGTKDNEDMNRLIDSTLKRIQEERHSPNTKDTSSVANNNNNSNLLTVPTTKEEERISNRGSISSANSFASAHNYELFDFEAANESDCYQSCSSEANSLMEDYSPSPATKSKFYQMLVDATLQEIELSTNIDDASHEDEHQYESIRHNIDPIYEEISDMPPPLPLTAPPLNDPELEKKSARSIFEGASKYDILSYLVDAKERGLVKEEPFDYPLNCSNPIIIEEESADTLSDLGKLSKLKRIDTISSRSSMMSDSSDDNQSSMSSLSPPSSNNFMLLRKQQQATSDIERNDSGVGSETSKTSRSKYFNPSNNAFLTNSNSSSTNSSSQPRSSPLHLCEDCDGPVETQIGENGIVFAPLVCRKCGKKRVERKEIITEVVETEEKYGRDLQIILEEFCHPMLVAGLLTQEQLSAIFLNTEELLENNQTLAERMRDSLDIALEQGDDDLLQVNIGKIFLDSTQMLHAFESYCVRQAGASLLLANLEKDKELLRIFLKVSQMENAVLRRMNLNSFLMVPVQRVTKYPLLLARLYKVTPSHLEGRDQLKQAQEKIELHLNHINQEAKDVPTKLWRRISSSSPNRRASCEIDMINIKLRKMAIDVLEWNHDEVRFVMEGKLLYTQPTDSNWKKARTIKLTTVNALLVTNGKPSTNYKAEKVISDKLNFPKHTGIREASLLVVKEKCGRYTLIREPLYLDRCVVCSEADWDEYFEIQEISSKDTFIFKAEDNVRTKQWYTQLQYHAQGMGAWRKRRNALANIMINGMLTRN